MLSVFLSLLILFGVLQQPALAFKKSYIVYLGGHSHGADVTSADLRRVADSHTQLLASFLGSEEKAKDAIFYSYKRHINGFAALLEDEEAARIAEHPDVASVFLHQGRKLHTTHSWDFLMLENEGVIPSSSLWNKARFGQDTIIANLDTGVWPESKSFSGKGFGPIPSKWKGICQFDHKEGPLCNRKLIGARYYNKGYAAYAGVPLNSTYNTPRDVDGHGTHTLSTAAGNFVAGANVFGFGNGTAKGGSPRARVAAYRVCYPKMNESSGECYDADIMKGFDAAIADGVGVLSVSLGSDSVDYINDGTAIGAFHAVKNGIVVVASAGNSGPTPGSVENVAPWFITVGASTLDRKFQANVQLKNGSIFQGMSLSKPLPEDKMYTLISAAEARAADVSEEDAILCKEKTLDSKKAKGKIVVCLRGENARLEKGEEALRAGAAGMILCNDESSGNELIADAHILPATQLNYTDGLIVFSYLKNTKNPQGLITEPKSVLNVKPAPFMASFSSRGPNAITPAILKPDITAPGVNIMAAYSESTSPTEVPSDKRTTPFYIESGTSMACPHVSGVAGLLKTLHPDWSPGAIRSAIMTTARTRDNTGSPMKDADYQKATPFMYGSGHIRPNRAMNPGLVYDLTVNDYLDFLCGIGYNSTMVGQFAGAYYDCPNNYNILNFNNPSISVPDLTRSVVVTRKLKNVGKPGTYAARIRSPPGYSVTVKPNLLKFEKIGEEKSFKLSIKVNGRRGAKSVFQFGELLWSDGKHYVRSPIVVASPNQ
ncbi:PREDICTED: LOW QUALITY PROTEIN: subtilisin-like protease SBT5.4 [Erythranthe guttata]|uniref:LOW QUALITY PROTEIN: subtilisin-like protease SBT5.4 n=1 Tax=Erythranthe guttata TaxID=4155 RepID=UPI00064D8CFF|nr:PREDICTED: LOW QUALITY PROTEIN: subtilisin-like protease SBT5.4 [Erythranthe guttata]|eukprot:XP_012849317.1 PREDICTED: LOW QUALITY PROTEIN: subtilisin-like protease SBT5.4 [Erythranthe guttata]